MIITVFSVIKIKSLSYIGLIGYFPTTRASLYVGAVWIVLLLLGYRRVKTKRVAVS